MKKTILVLVLACSLGAAAQIPNTSGLKQNARNTAEQQNNAARATNNSQNVSTSPAPKPTPKPATAPKSTTRATSAKPAASVTTAPAGSMTTPAHQAALSGDVAALTAFANGDVVKLQMRDDQGKTPLLLAAWKGNKDVVAYLIESRVDLTAADPSGATPLHVAATNGHAEVLVLLLDAGVDPNVAAKDNGQTPLHRAAAQGRREAVKALLAHGAKKDAVDAKGKTPAQLAEFYQQNDWQDVMDQIKHAP